MVTMTAGIPAELDGRMAWPEWPRGEWQETGSKATQVGGSPGIPGSTVTSDPLLDSSWHEELERTCGDEVPERAEWCFIPLAPLVSAVQMTSEVSIRGWLGIPRDVCWSRDFYAATEPNRSFC